MADTAGLPDDWEDAPPDPPRGATGADDVIASEVEGVVHVRVCKRVPRASGSGSLAPSRAWLSAPPSAWEPAEPTGPAARER